MTKSPNVKPDNSAPAWWCGLRLKCRNVKLSVLNGPQFRVFYQSIGNKAWLTSTVHYATSDLAQSCGSCDPHQRCLLIGEGWGADVYRPYGRDITLIDHNNSAVAFVTKKMNVRPTGPCTLYLPFLSTIRGRVAAFQAQKATVRILQLADSLCYNHQPLAFLCPIATRLSEHTKGSRVLGVLLGQTSWFWLYMKRSCGWSVGNRLVASPRILFVVRAQSTSSPRNVISERISPSERPSRLAWTIHRLHRSSGNAPSIFGAMTHSRPPQLPGELQCGGCTHRTLYLARPVSVIESVYIL